jgi:hypothetical protein
LYDSVTLEPRNSQTGSLRDFADEPVAEIVPNTQPSSSSGTPSIQDMNASSGQFLTVPQS